MATPDRPERSRARLVRTPALVALGLLLLLLGLAAIVAAGTVLDPGTRPPPLGVGFLLFAGGAMLIQRGEQEDV